MKSRRFIAVGALMLLGLLSTGSQQADATVSCEEAILVWSWAHMDWICSASDAGGQVCILCSGPGQGPRQQD